MTATKQTIRRRREIIEAAAGAAEARSRGDERTARAFGDDVADLFRLQSGAQGPARHLFNETYRHELATFQAS